MSVESNSSTWPHDTPSVRHRIYSVLFISIVWISSLIFLLLGLPVLIYQAITHRISRSAKLSTFLTSVIVLCCTDENVFS